MNKGLMVFAAATGLLLGAQNVQAQESGNVIVVKMIDKSATEFVFEPADVTAKPGDIIRWEQTATTPHNVDFKGETDIDGATGGEYLTTPGETFEVEIDDRFAPGGEYPYVCTPHEAMGMTGTITVEAANR